MWPFSCPVLSSKRWEKGCDCQEELRTNRVLLTVSRIFEALSSFFFCNGTADDTS